MKLVNALLALNMSGSTRQDTLVHRGNVGGTMLVLGTTLVQAAFLIYQQDTLISTARSLVNVAGHLKRVMFQHNGKGNILGLQERKLKIMIQLTLPHMNYQMNHLRDRLMKIRRNHNLRHLPMMLNLHNLSQERREDLRSKRKRNFAQQMLQVNLDRLIGHALTFRFHSTI